MSMSEIKRPECKTCPYWEKIPIGSGDDGFGYCIRYAPRPIAVPRHRIEESNIIAAFPKTDSGEGCGEHPDFPMYIKTMIGSE